MAIKHTIFNIIKSLSMNEKRYFKIYCKQHVLNGQNKYVLLFDLIDQQTGFLFIVNVNNNNFEIV